MTTDRRESSRWEPDLGARGLPDLDRRRQEHTRQGAALIVSSTPIRVCDAGPAMIKKQTSHFVAPSTIGAQERPPASPIASGPSQGLAEHDQCNESAEMLSRLKAGDGRLATPRFT